MLKKKKKNKIMASSPNTAWQIEEERWEYWHISSPWAPKSLDSDCSHEIRRQLLFGRKAMTNLDNVLKSRDITLPAKVHMVLPVVMWGCENWTIKKAECQRIDAFKLWCWRKLLKVPWTARRSNQTILREINPEYLLEGLMLKLKLHQMGTDDSL